MSTAALDSDSISYVCTLVRRRSAIELDAGKAYLIEARLSPLARKHGYPSTTDMIRTLQSKPNGEVQQQLVEAMTTNETSFFRDAHPFDALRTTIVPELLRTRSAKKTLNIWSAASSTGQEAYSIAMLLQERFPELASWSVRILGTDLSDDVLEKARAARFSQVEINRGLPAALLAKYFRREGMQWELAAHLRSMVSFCKLNLIERWPSMPTMDVVFLRNVLIYFSPDTKKAILEKVRSVMAPRAVLFLGAAETTMGLDSAFERVQIDSSVFYRLK
ncbi:MAG: protein-glutamate O-methyltransferase CheR [Planctomycetia bacterium]|nr:protein-glutamate O-methyltransferase CheR [Planctomycetia bacterium]